MKRTIEICCGTVAEAKLAETAGAIRVELCAALALEGITPSIAVVQRVRQETNLTVNVLIRPREGDFVYTEDEIQTMIADIKAVKAVGAHGAVIGALTKDGKLDVDAVRRMVDAAKPELSVTFHRAFDVVENPMEALETIISLGCDRVLTSGQAASAQQGEAMLAALVKQADGRIIIMPGGGVNPDNIAEIETATGAKEFHASARRKNPNAPKIDPTAAFASGPSSTTDADLVAGLVGE